MQMWFNGRMSASQAEHAGSIPVICSKNPVHRSGRDFTYYLLPLHSCFKKCDGFLVK